MYRTAYILEAVHIEPRELIVSFQLPEEKAESIIARLWAGENLWAAPGGCSFIIESQADADAVNDVLGTCFIQFNPDRHRWLFHIYLVAEDEG